MRHLAGEELENAILVIDEAHNLPDRARKIFSPEILDEHIQAVEGGLLLRPEPVFDEIRTAIGGIARLLDDAAKALRDGQAIAEIDPPKSELGGAWKIWEPVFLRYLAWKKESKFVPPDDPVINLHFAFQRFMAILNQYGPGFACVIERRRTGLRLALVCLDPARPLKPIFQAASSAVFLSATLSPAQWTRRALGLEHDRTEAISLPPPFPRENRKVLILPQVRTHFAARGQNYARIAELIAEMSDAGTGNTLALFPSCQRFLQTPYVGRLPRDWYQHSPMELISRRPAEEIASFFGGRRGEVKSASHSSEIP